MHVTTRKPIKIRRESNKIETDYAKHIIKTNTVERLDVIYKILSKPILYLNMFATPIFLV